MIDSHESRPLGEEELAAGRRLYDNLRMSGYVGFASAQNQQAWHEWVDHNGPQLLAAAEENTRLREAIREATSLVDLGADRLRPYGDNGRQRVRSALVDIGRGLALLDAALNPDPSRSPEGRS